MAFPNSYGQQQAAYGQASAGGQAGDIFANQGYAAQQVFAGGATYDAYGHPVNAADPRYAYQAAQMAAMAGAGEDQRYVVSSVAQSSVVITLMLMRPPPFPRSFQRGVHGPVLPAAAGADVLRPDERADDTSGVGRELCTS